MMATLEKGAASFQGSTSLQPPPLEGRAPVHAQSAEPPQHASEGCWSWIGQQCPNLTVSVPRGAPLSPPGSAPKRQIPGPSPPRQVHTSVTGLSNLQVPRLLTGPPARLRTSFGAAIHLYLPLHACSVFSPCHLAQLLHLLIPVLQQRTRWPAAGGHSGPWTERHWGLMLKYKLPHFPAHVTLTSFKTRSVGSLCHVI